MRSKKNSSSAKGFSLMEMLMVMVISPIIFFAVYSNFSAGIRLWTRLSQTGPEEDLSIFYTKVGRDLRGMMRYEDIPFTGEKQEIVFPAVIDAPASLGGDRGIGAVRLYYHSDSRTIRREVKDLSRLYREADGISKVLFQNVADLEFSYYTSDPLSTEFFWTDTWEPQAKKLPVAVRLSFSVDGLPDRQEKTEVIPVGGLIK